MIKAQGDRHDINQNADTKHHACDRIIVEEQVHFKQQEVPVMEYRFTTEERQCPLLGVFNVEGHIQKASSKAVIR